MAHLEARYWEGQAAGPTRRDRHPCNYAVYLPDKLCERRFILDGDVAADVAIAEAALVRLDTTASALANTEALARLLLRAECVASSRIEGLEVDGRACSALMRRGSWVKTPGMLRPRKCSATSTRWSGG